MDANTQVTTRVVGTFGYVNHGTCSGLVHLETTKAMLLSLTPDKLTNTFFT